MVVRSKHVERWNLSRLKRHPQQDDYFDDLSDVEIDALAADMAEHGQRDAIEVLPDGTVLAGHQRWRAAKKLKWKMVDVIVRHDLADAGDGAQETYFITSNLLRRHLTPLGRARCIRRLMELETGRATEKYQCWDRDELKTRVGQLMNMSARNISRYLLVLETPIEVQRAFDSGELKLVEAGRVALLGKEVRAAIAERIVAGESAAAVVRESLKPNKAGDGLHRAFIRLRSCLSRELPQLDGRIDEIGSRALACSFELLRKSHDLIGALVERADAHRDDEDNHDPFPGFAVSDTVSTTIKTRTRKG